MKILAIDVGGTHVKVLATGRRKPLEIRSGPKMTATQMVRDVRQGTAGWSYEVVSIGYPGPVLHGKPVSEPSNLGGGWVGFDFTKGLHAYTAYFADRAGASANQVLFVAPTEQRERQIAHLLPDHSDAERESCRFWTTTTAFIAATGPLGAVWASDVSKRRVSLLDMAGLPRSDRHVEDAVGKPAWWLRRPGGGGGS